MIILLCVCLVVLTAIDMVFIAVVINCIFNHDLDLEGLRVGLISIVLTVAFAFILYNGLSEPPKTIEHYGHTYILETEQPEEVESE